MQKFGKFIILFTLILMSISSCYSSPFNCYEHKKDVKSEVSANDSTPVTHSDCNNDDCVCHVRCHNLLMTFSLVTIP